MRLSRRAGGTAAAAAFCLLLSACGGDYNNGSSGGGSSKAGGEDGPLKVNMAVAPATLDPASGCGANDFAMIGEPVHAAHAVRLQGRPERHDRGRPRQDRAVRADVLEDSERRQDVHVQAPARG